METGIGISIKKKPFGAKGQYCSSLKPWFNVPRFECKIVGYFKNPRKTSSEGAVLATLFNSQASKMFCHFHFRGPKNVTFKSLIRHPFGNYMSRFHITSTKLVKSDWVSYQANVLLSFLAQGKTRFEQCTYQVALEITNIPWLPHLL